MKQTSLIVSHALRSQLFHQISGLRYYSLVYSVIKQQGQDFDIFKQPSTDTDNVCIFFYNVLYIFKPVIDYLACLNVMYILLACGNDSNFHISMGIFRKIRHQIFQYNTPVTACFRQRLLEILFTRLRAHCTMFSSQSFCFLHIFNRF